VGEGEEDELFKAAEGVAFWHFLYSVYQYICIGKSQVGGERLNWCLAPIM
jgi:hypothetical protein